MRSAAGESEPTRNARPASGAVTVAAVMKQERPYIIEWVAWHRLLGFEIMIADNDGSDGQTELLRRLADAGLISYLDVRHFRWRPQHLAYYAMFRRAQKAAAAYLGFLDADEFFEPLSANIAGGAPRWSGGFSTPPKLLPLLSTGCVSAARIFKMRAQNR